jgi:histidine transport system permease protein
MTMLLAGYGPLIAIGAWLTLKVAMLSLLVAFSLGMVCAIAKLSSSRVAVWLATGYTTLIRGVPDLVLMLLIYYSVQIWLNNLTESMGLNQIDIDPFSAAIITLGFIYGAYFTETFRGAFLSVPVGQMEAAYAFGMTRAQAFRRIQFPQMMRFALPGLSNNWQVLLKSAGLVSLLGLNDMVKAARQAGDATARQFFFYGVVAVIFLLFTTVSQIALQYLERRYAMGVRESQL